MVVTDHIARALLTNVINELKEYFKIEVRYSIDRNALEDYVESMSKQGENNDKTDALDRRADIIIAWNRTPLKIDDKQKQNMPREMRMGSSADLKMFNMKSFFMGKFDIDCTVISPVREYLSIFEAIYLMEFKAQAHLMHIEFDLPDCTETLETSYNLNWEDLSSYDFHNYSSSGALSGIGFSVTVDGAIFIPEYGYFPKLIDTKVNYIVPPLDDPEVGYDMTTKVHNVFDEVGNVQDTEVSHEKDVLNVMTGFEKKPSK